MNNVDEKFLLWSRNVRDQYKDIPTEDIKADLQSKCFPSSILMSQITGDFNIASVIRSANSFNFKSVYYYGNKRYDKRGTLGTHHYIDVHYLDDIEQIKLLKEQYHFVALENNINRHPINIKDYSWNYIKPSLICIGEEGQGLTDDILELADDCIEIESRGSVRSLNAAVAASIAMYDYYCKAI